MKEKYPFLRIVTAILPLLAYTGRFRETFYLGGILCLTLWGTALVIKITWPLFPAGLRRTAVILGLVALIMAGHYLADYPVMAGISLYLLLPRDTEEKMPWNLFVRRLAGHGLGFWILMTMLALCQELFGQMMSVGIFRQPAGSFLVLALAALFWQTQPGLQKGAA